MRPALDPFSFLVISIAGWMNQHQQHVIDYLIEENRVLREQIRNRRLRFSDDQRRPESDRCVSSIPNLALNPLVRRPGPGYVRGLA